MSKKRAIVMFDIDGVLADFVLGFTTLAHEVFGTEIYPTRNQQKWNFGDLLTAGEQDTLWGMIKRGDKFWRELPLLVTGDECFSILKLAREHRVYFVTARVGDSVIAQTTDWLFHMVGVVYAPIIVSAKKGDIAAAIGATHAIDDKAENAWCISWISGARSFLIDRPYNQYSDNMGTTKVKRITTVQEFCDEVHCDTI